MNRASLSWCLVSMDGCLTRTDGPVHSPILRERPVKVQLHPKYQENQVSIHRSLWCFFYFPNSLLLLWLCFSWVYVCSFLYTAPKLQFVCNLLIFFFFFPIVDPSSLVAGDMAMVHQAILGRTSTGRGRIFTGTSTRLEKQGSALSTLSPPAVTSTRMAV